jgi:hypothetical protein
MLHGVQVLHMIVAGRCRLPLSHEESVMFGHTQKNRNTEKDSIDKIGKRLFEWLLVAQEMHSGL